MTVEIEWSKDGKKADFFLITEKKTVMLSGHSSLLPLETLPDKVKIARCLGVLYTHRRQKSLAEVTDTAPHLALSQATLQKTLRV